MEARPATTPVRSGDARKRKARQPLPPALARFGAPAWEIYRLELVYFDPEFRRWQLFQEQPDLAHSLGGDAKHPINHRRTIQKLLQSIRTLFENLPLAEWGIPLQAATDHVRDTHGKEGEYVTLSITPSQRKHYTACLKHEVISAFFGALEKYASTDNILKPNPALQTAITKLREWLETPNTDKIEIDRKAARQIISLLPVLPHWDLWGAIRQGWETSEKKGIPPSPFQRLGKLRSPFYTSHFIYQYNGTEDGHLNSRKLLGYSVLAEAEYIDLDDRQARPDSIHLRDYFDYACPPRRKELTAYRLYAFLLDRLQLGLSGQEADSEAENKIEHLYYVAWPIFTSLGRRHFLQLYARPVPDCPAPAARHLHDAFLQLHQHMSWADLRDILGEELTQVDLDRFHAHIADQLNEITDGRYVAEEHSDAVLIGLMARNLELLMPVDAAQHWHSGNPADQEAVRWSYQSFGEIIPLGSEWTKQKSDLSSSLPEAFGDLSWQTASLGRETPTQRELRKAFRHWLVERQLRALQRDWDAKRYERERKRHDAESLWKTRHYPHLVAQAHSILATVKHAMQGRDRFKDVTFTLGEETRVSSEEFFRPYFYFKGLDSAAHSSWEDAYRCLLTANGHLTVSHFVETGVLHWLTHPDLQHTKLLTRAIRAALSASTEALKPILDGVHEASLSTCLNCVSSYASEIVSRVEAETITACSLAKLTTLSPPKVGLRCDQCDAHGETLPEWLKPPGQYGPPRITHALMDLQKMRERALRSPTQNENQWIERGKSMFGLIDDDRLVPCAETSPMINLAPAGLSGWKEALNQLRGHGGHLTAFFFAETMIELPRGHAEGEFFGPTKFQRNYLAIFKDIEDNAYGKIGDPHHTVNRLQTFQAVLRGLGFVYCMKLEKRDGQVKERFCFIMPEWADITATVQRINKAVFDNPFTELDDGYWEAIVVVLDRVKR
jgi:hypothetical protein